VIEDPAKDYILGYSGQSASADFTLNKSRIPLNDDCSSLNQGKSRLRVRAGDLLELRFATPAVPFPRIGKAFLSVRDLACLSWAR
jgi:hypothetical protein